MKLPSKKQYAATLIALFAAVFLALPAYTNAQLDPRGSNYGLDDFQNIGIGQERDLQGTIANIINIVLSFLGIIAVVIIIAGGFKWMTAAGNEESVTEARGMIVQAVIGLVIIFMAWVIAEFVINQLRTATNA